MVNSLYFHVYGRVLTENVIQIGKSLLNDYSIQILQLVLLKLKTVHGKMCKRMLLHRDQLRRILLCTVSFNSSLLQISSKSVFLFSMNFPNSLYSVRIFCKNLVCNQSVSYQLVIFLFLPSSAQIPAQTQLNWAEGWY